MIDGIRNLTGRLKKKGIGYCHWKSNFNIFEAAEGLTDFDLLVGKDDFSDLVSILMELKFKQAESNCGPPQPGVYHFFQYDDKADRLIHVHAYVRTLTGDSFTKSFALPLEKMLLKERSLHSCGVMTPSRAAELVVFVVRNLIKSASLPDCWLLQRNYEVLLEELNWLAPDENKNEAIRLLNSYLPEIKHELFEKALTAFSRKSAFLQRLFLGMQAKSKLCRYRRFGFWEQLIRTAVCVISMQIRKRFFKKGAKILSGGGSIIAFVGPQATGKSTLSAMLHQWIGKQFSVCRIHAGKPPSSMPTLLPNIFLPLLRKCFPGQRSTHIEQQVESDQLATYSYLHLVRKIILAYDRKVLLLRAYRQSRNGQIIISDRYPSEIAGAVDGASFPDEKIRAEKSWTKRRLMRLERRIYDKIPPPDLVVQLNVPVEEAVYRNRIRDKKGPKDPEYVRFKHAKKIQPVFTQPETISVTTRLGLEQTFAEVKKFVWERI